MTGGGVQMEAIAVGGPVLYDKNVTIAWGRRPGHGLFEEGLETLGNVQDKFSFLCECFMKPKDTAQAYQLYNDRKVNKVLLQGPFEARST